MPQRSGGKEGLYYLQPFRKKIGRLLGLDTAAGNEDPVNICVLDGTRDSSSGRNCCGGMWRMMIGGLFITLPPRSARHQPGSSRKRKGHTSR